MTIGLHQLAALGQTVWLDSMSHDLIQSGALTVLISRGIRGGTLDLASYAPLIAHRRGAPTGAVIGHNPGATFTASLDKRRRIFRLLRYNGL